MIEDQTTFRKSSVGVDHGRHSAFKDFGDKVTVRCPEGADVTAFVHEHERPCTKVLRSELKERLADFDSEIAICSGPENGRCGVLSSQVLQRVIYDMSGSTEAPTAG